MEHKNYELTWERASRLPLADECRFYYNSNQLTPRYNKSRPLSDEDDGIWAHATDQFYDMSEFRINEMSALLKRAEKKFKKGN